MSQKRDVTKKVLKVYAIVFVLFIAVALIWAHATGYKPTNNKDTAPTHKATQTAATTAKPSAPHTPTTNEKLTKVLQSLKQHYSSVNDIYIYTSSKDPAGGLNKPGYYTAGAAYCDTPNTFYSPSDTTTTGGSKNAYGYACGGTIQIYKNTDDAAKAVTYLKSVTTEPNTGKCLINQGNSECSYVRTGDAVIHVSDMYTDSQQQNLLNFLSSQVVSQSL